DRGSDIADIDLEAVAGIPAIVLRATNGRAIDRVPPNLAGKALLIHTGWSRHWRTETYWNNQHPFVTRRAAEELATSGVRVVGIDSYNIDDTADGTRPAHTELLRAGIFIVEHLTNLESLPDSGDIRFFAVPPKVRGLDSFPVRAFAITR
ncbi:MAG TPA: cyclase family protein, partial [Thermoanaerobaculia bacterium]|nr:cyclase family protein [Thermoanaerobaculia bacterium]